MRRSLFCSFAKLLCLISVAAVVYILTPASFAQVATGTPPFGSFASGPDMVNLANLNDHLTIPVLHKAGRGTDFRYDLSYDSSVWYPVGVSPNQLWQPVSNLGWASQTQGPNGYIAYSTTQIKITCTTGNHIIYKTYYISQFTYTTYYDQLGAAHAVNATVSQQLIPGYTGCSPNPAYPYNKTVQATDGSGLTYSLTADPSASVTTAAGTIIYPPFNQVSGSGSYTDRNGNMISTSGGIFTDTLGTTALTVTGGGTATSPMVFTYTPPNTSSSRCVSTNTTGVACYSMNYTNFTLATNFGVSGIGEYKSSAAVPLVSSIVLADGSQYTFQYEATPGSCTPYSGTTCVTGRVTQITLPTGGRISFAYSFTGCTTTIFKDGSAACLQRTTPDGAWTYARTLGTSPASTTLVTAPKMPYDSAANQTIIQFQGIYETQRDVYKGLAPSFSGWPIAENVLQVSNLLKETQTCYNSSTTSCTTTAVALPITQRTITRQLDGASSWLNALTAQHIEKYSSYGVPIERDEYDYGVGAVGALLGKTTLTVQPLGNVKTFYQEAKVTNGIGATVSDTFYVYDGTSVVATSGTPQHASVSGSRGNLTSVSYYYNTSGYIQAHVTYFDTGNVQTVTDVNGAQTTFTYAACGNSYPTSVSEPLSMSRSLAWNCTGGVPTSVTDENNQVTSITYSDPYFWRPASESFPDTGQTSWTYNNNPTSVTTTTTMNSSQNIVSKVLLDGVGRTSQTQLTSDPEGTDYTDTTYDPLGRVYSVSNPYRSTSDPTYGITKYQYDALSRVTQVTLQDGSVANTSYTNNTMTATDPAGKKRQTTLDALARVTQVNEDPSGLNYATTYGYDPLGNLLSVTQNGGRQRAFVYDELSRLTSESNPETGTITYKYDSDSNCASPNSSSGDLVSRTNARSIRTCYQYDALHRVTQKNYSDGITPTAFFSWDGSGRWGVTQTNTNGRLGEEWTGTSCCATGGAEIFGYDAMGRITMNEQYTVAMGYVPVNYTYDLAGDTLTATNIAGYKISYQYDAAARPTSVTSNFVDSQHPATLATVDSSVGYYPPGALRKMTLGNSLTQAAAFNNSLQPCRINVNSSNTALGACADSIPSGNVQDFNYGFNAGSTDNGNVASWTATGQQAFGRAFTYDSLNRLATLNQSSGNTGSCSSAFNLSWTYDAWGNRTDQTVNSGTCNPFHQLVNTQNQLSGSPFQYDAAGNMTNDGNHTYFYDAENRLIQVDGTLGTCSTATACYLYDALGHRTESARPGSSEDFLHNLSGQVVGDWGTRTGYTGWDTGYVYLNGSLLAQYQNSTTHFAHLDHLGSTRLLTGLDQSVVQNLDYLPFGELNSTDSGINSHKFTGDERDSETNLDHTWFRQYSSQLGRWMHPDPAGLLAVDPANPQSWNRYAYVLNNPLGLTDPFGLCGGGEGDNGGPCYDGWYIGDDGCVYSVTYSKDSNGYDIPSVTQVACGVGPGPGGPNGPQGPTGPGSGDGGAGGGGNGSNGPAPLHPGSPDIVIVAHCEAEAKAAMDAEPSPAPDKYSVTAGVITALLNMAIRGASAGSAGAGFAIGMGGRSAGNIMWKGAAFQGTFHGCLEAAGMDTAPFGPFGYVH